MRTPLDSLITERSLVFINQTNLIDVMLSGALTEVLEEGETSQLPQLKNVCAKVSAELSDKLDYICGILDIHKRKFIETAFIDAVIKSEEIMENEGIFDCLEQRRIAEDNAHAAYEATQKGGV